MDGDSSLARAERGRANDAQDGEEQPAQSFDSICALHRLAGCREAVCSGAQGQQSITCFKRAALSLHVNNGISVFRRILRETLKRRPLHIIRQPPPPHFLEKHNRILEVLLPDSVPGNIVRRYLWRTTFTGDWEDRTCLMVYVDAEPEGPPDSEIRRRLEEDIPTAAVMRGPLSFPGRGWTRPEHTPAWLALMSLTHGLFEEAYPAWVEKITGAPAKGRQGRAANALAPLMNAPVAQGGGPGPAVGAHIDPTQKERLKQQGYRQTVIDVLRSDPMECVFVSTVYAVVLRRHSHLMSHYLFLGGERWMREQQLLEMRRASASNATREDIAASFAASTSRVSVMYDGKEEQLFLANVIDDMESTDQWLALPRSCYKEKKRDPHVHDVGSRSRSRERIPQGQQELPKQARGFRGATPVRA